MRNRRSSQSLNGDSQAKHQRLVSVDGFVPLLENSKIAAYVSLLKDCGWNKNLVEGSKVHDDIVKQGLLEKRPHLISSLICMYVKCGAIEKARIILDESHASDIISWSSLISGYAQQGQGYESLKFFDRMKLEGLSPDNVTFTCILKACGIIGAIEKGKRIHEEMMSRGLPNNDIVLGTALVDMYTKSGMLEKAKQVLEEFPLRDVVAWSAIIGGYSRQGKGYEALKSFERMRIEGISPNAVTFICILMGCGSIGGIQKGKQIHEEVLSRDLLNNNIVLGNSLVEMYVRCSMLSEAHRVLEELPTRNIISWNSLMAGYVQQGQYHEALDCFRCIQNEGFPASVITYISILKACACIGDIEEGEKVHDQILGKGLLEKNIVLGTAVVNMYAKCGMVEKAQYVLEELTVRDVVAWSALIAGYAQQGQYSKALNCFERMQSEGFTPDAVTFTCILKACGNTQSLDKGRQIHEFVANQGLLEKDIMVGNAVIDMYVKCGELARAQQVLDGLHIRDIVSWSAMISGYAQQGQGHEALNCFERMQTEGLSPNMITFICCLKACGFLGDAQKGQEIHRAIMQKGLLGADVMLGNALVDMYAKCGNMSKAQQVLEELPVRDVDTWAAIISGYAQQEQYQEALGSLEKMRGEGISPNASIFTCIFKICGAIGDIDKGEEIHSEVASRGLLKKDIVLGTSMVDMYARCGFLSKAQQMLRSLHGRDVVSWNALLSAYAQEGQSQEALKCFESMQFEGVRPNAITFTCILKVCASIGAIGKGKQIHELIAHSGLLKTDIILGNTLVDMYAKCGLLDKAQKLHKELPVRSVVSWSAIIVGYANQGQGQEAFDCFKQMKKDGFNPDGVTILSLLSACGHSGLLDEAQVLFGNMVQEYGITPSVDHQTCMVVALGSAGYFDKAVSVIKAMPYSDYLQVWVVLLGTCKKWGNVKLGMLAFDQAVQLDCSCAAGYAIMSTIFAAAGLHEDAEKVEALRLKYAS